MPFLSKYLDVIIEVQTRGCQLPPEEMERKEECFTDQDEIERVSELRPHGIKYFLQEIFCNLITLSVSCKKLHELSIIS